MQVSQTQQQKQRGWKRRLTADRSPRSSLLVSAFSPIVSALYAKAGGAPGGEEGGDSYASEEDVAHDDL